MLLRSLHRGVEAADGLSVLATRCVAALASWQQPQALGVAAQQQQCRISSSGLDQLHQQQQQQHTQQQLHSVSWQQQQQQLHPLSAARHFTSSSSVRSVDQEQQQPAPDAFIVPDPQQAAQQREADLKRLLQDMPARLLNQPIFTNGLSSKIRSRKPAIKAPARHQWRFCAEDYDPMAPFPAKGLAQDLPPYAPLRAHAKDYKQIYRETRPKFHRGRWVDGWVGGSEYVWGGGQITARGVFGAGGSSTAAQQQPSPARLGWGTLP
jgi:hypothetical protein